MRHRLDKACLVEAGLLRQQLQRTDCRLDRSPEAAADR